MAAALEEKEDGRVARRFLGFEAPLSRRDSPALFGISFNCVGGPENAPIKIASRRFCVSFDSSAFFIWMLSAMVTKADLEPQKVLDSNGDTSARDVFVSVGYALSQWEHTEESLASLYSFLCGPRSTHAAFRSYGTLTATMPRRNIIRAAADVFFLTFPKPELSDRLDSLLGLYMDAGARRNEIAHGVVMGNTHHTIVNNVAAPLPTKWYLVPALHSTKKQSLQLQAEYRFSSGTIDKYVKAFDELHSAINAYRKDLIAHCESFPEKVREQYT